jgi:hypothetical protein
MRGGIRNKGRVRATFSLKVSNWATMVVMWDGSAGSPTSGAPESCMSCAIPTVAPDDTGQTRASTNGSTATAVDSDRPTL